MKIQKLIASDYPAVKQIYLEGIATGQATFQTDAPSWPEWDQSHLSHSRIILSDNGTVAGWAALTPVSSRCVYAGLAELSIYVAASYRGKGIGDQLLKALIRESEANNVWTLQAGIFPENIASINLHRKNGFRIIGIREKVGKMNAAWRDTALLERRSKTIGVD